MESKSNRIEAEKIKIEAKLSKLKTMRQKPRLIVKFAVVGLVVAVLFAMKYSSNWVKISNRTVIQQLAIDVV